MYHITLSLDENNISGLIATINSILLNTKESNNLIFNILVYENVQLFEEIIKKYFGKYQSIFNIREFKVYTNYVDFLNENINVLDKKFNYIANIMNFARFYLPEIFNEINIGVYLDSDIIVQHDITEIFQDPNLLANLNDFKIASPLNRDLSDMEFDESLNMMGKGFNTGVYILNFDYWRSNNLTKKCEEIMIQHKQKKLFKLGTQPIINILFYNNCTNINKRWNITGLGSKIMDSKYLENGYILHWTGSKKPWLIDGLNKSFWNTYNIYDNNFRK